MRNTDCLVLDTNYCWLVRGLVKLNRGLNIASNFILDSFYPWHVGAVQKIDHSIIPLRNLVILYIFNC